MRLLRRRRGRASGDCSCRLCRPDGPLGPRDQKVLDDVQAYGVHVVLVSDAYPCACGHEPGEAHDHGEQPAQPDFAYTVGLWHQRRHPELLMSGLPSREVMHRSLNDLAGLVMAGEALRPGEVYEDVLAGVGVTVEHLTDEARAETVTWSSWFHGRDVPALQVVWPDRDGVFAWQGAAAALDERQPPAWRVAGPRVGALAPDPDWPFAVPSDAVAFTCRHLADGEASPRYVQHDRDDERGEDWSVSCGDEHAESGDLVLCHLSHLVTRSPALRELADLGLDEWADRADARSPWNRYREDPAEG